MLQSQRLVAELFDDQAEVSDGMEVSVGREFLGECYRIQPGFLGNAAEIAAVDRLIDEMAEAAKDLPDSPLAKFTIGIEGECVGEPIVGHPVHDGLALKALLVSSHASSYVI
jgi:hypothetical protein